MKLRKIFSERKRSLAPVWIVTLVALLLGSLPCGAASLGRSVTASSKDWTVTVWVARTSTKAGTTIAATVTVDNRSGHRVPVTGCPGADYEMLVGNSKVPNSPIIATVLCVSTMGPGVHVFHTKVRTSYQGCGGGGNPPCGNPPKMSPLPVGTYRTELVLPGSEHALPMPRPLTIILTP